MKITTIRSIMSPKLPRPIVLGADSPTAGGLLTTRTHTFPMPRRDVGGRTKNTCRCRSGTDVTARINQDSELRVTCM
jgi:hypothetical protein